MSKVLINSFSKFSKENKVFLDIHWTHSFVCGMMAKVIADELCFTSDGAFMGGLIHDIGKLIMLETFSDDYAADYWMTRFSNEEILHEELQIFSFTHDQVGGQLLRKWDFPENLITAVSNHHLHSEAEMTKSLALVVQLADFLSFHCCNQDSLGDEGIVKAFHGLLPNLKDQWEAAGLSLENNRIVGWFNWLVSNYEEGCNLKEAFSA